MTLDESLNFVNAELEAMKEKTEKKMQTTVQIHNQMVKKYQATENELIILRARKKAIEEQIENLEKKQENRRKFHQQCKASQKKN